jgi:hypothetical protein
MSNEEDLKSVKQAIEITLKSISSKRDDPNYSTMQEYLTGYEDACKFLLNYVQDLEKKSNKAEV